MMTRREWLRQIAIAIAGGATLDWDKLLWVPGRKKVFIPPPVVKYPPLQFLNTRNLEMYVKASERFKFGFAGFKNSGPINGDHVYATNIIEPSPTMQKFIIEPEFYLIRRKA